MATLTSEAKQGLARTIRELRARLLRDLHDAAESRYRLSVPLAQAKLGEEPRKRRERLEAWIDERARSTSAKNKQELEAARARFRLDAEKEAAATLLNRLVLLRHLEGLGLSKPAVVTGGWNSKGYRELRQFAPALLGDETEGYAALLQLVFDELALDLPGLFGDVGLTRLFPVPAATLREVVEKLDAPALESAWTDDTTLGWVYQYWNDPAREELDAKIAGGGKIEPYEIASKTQMFTERYMVEWLLHNSLGLTWLCICKKNGWTADAEAILPILDARRADWRKRREAGEVALDALMPIEGELEEQWKYFVPQPIPDDAVANAPGSIHTLKLLDPACGSGHFLVIAFDLLAAMYREEARHKGEEISERAIAESILENNLYGIDIDPRAVQIAAAAVMLKAKRLSREARPKQVNLVAPNLRLAELPKDDPALVQLRREIRAETGIPEELTNRLVEALKGADHLGTLLKVDKAIDEAVEEQGRAALVSTQPAQGNLLSGAFPLRQQAISFESAKRSVLERLELFLAKHGGEHDLGLRLDGEQLAAGLRFIRLVKEGSYDVVVGNPPYQGTSKMKDAKYVAAHYPRGKADLYAAFLERGLELARKGGLSAMVTMRGWMFLTQFTKLRENLLQQTDLRTLGDVDRGAFSSVPDEVLAAAMSIFRKLPPGREPSIAMQPTPLSDKTRDAARTERKRAAVLAQVGRFEFEVERLKAIDGQPVIYWWSDAFWSQYTNTPPLSVHCDSRKGIVTGNDTRFTRLAYEIRFQDIGQTSPWAPFVMGGKGMRWFEPLRNVFRWSGRAFETAIFGEISVSVRMRDPSMYFKRGIAFTPIGSEFSARVHRHCSITGNMGSSVVPKSIPEILCSMNTRVSQDILISLNPGLHFELGDIERLPFFRVANASKIFEVMEYAFGEHESAREASIEFKRPGPSCWASAQTWAQISVDRLEDEPLPTYAPDVEPPRSIDFVSFAMGVALGRFGADGEGLLDVPPPTALPHGILFLSSATEADGFAHEATKLSREMWSAHGAALGGGELRDWLRTGFFKHHRETYENRPIYFPLSSAKKSFVAWVSIHRWTSSTLSTLLADHLLPEKRRLEGELSDLRSAKAKDAKGGKAKAERRFADVQKLFAELTDFIDLVTQCAERGPPPTSPNETAREVDAKYDMDLDDGVMVNSAALWPLLEPQWKEPKKWWHELAEAKGRKDYDWAHLAKRYFPKRVEAKCVEDPSLAVAHGCFWRLHPAKAFAWELRLQDEIGPSFTLDEAGSDEARARWIEGHANEAEEARASERKRRERKSARNEKSDGAEGDGPLFEQGDGEGEPDDAAGAADE